MTLAERLNAAGVKGITIWPYQRGTWQVNVTFDKSSWNVQVGDDVLGMIEKAIADVAKPDVEDLLA